MGSGDLNAKKSWNPHSRENLRRAREAEQTAKRERERIDELRRERDAQLDAEEILQLQQAQGIATKRVERIDWMYNEEATLTDAHTEDVLLGKQPHSILPSSGDIMDRRTITWSGEQSATSRPQSALRDDPLNDMRRTEAAIPFSGSRRPVHAHSTQGPPRVAQATSQSQIQQQRGDSAQKSRLGLERYSRQNDGHRRERSPNRSEFEHAQKSQVHRRFDERGSDLRKDYGNDRRT